MDRRSNTMPYAIRTGGLLILLLVLVWTAARSGYASLLTAQAALSNQLGPADSAVRLDGGDPDARHVRGTILENIDLPQAVREHYEAALDRPSDYVLWLTLARARELNGDTQGAILAARQAVPFAPDYAEPHYQLGNILVRAGQSQEAFKELRFAGESNPTLLPGAIDLAWRVFSHNPKTVEDAFMPATRSTYRALGEFFRQQKEWDAAISMDTSAGALATEARKSLLGDLINAKHFKQAAVLWNANRPENLKPGLMIDQGFEQESNLNEGFGWRVGERYEGYRLSLDTNKPFQGNSSLRIDFGGNIPNADPLLSQLVLADPQTHYHLEFAARSEKIVSGGLPLIAVRDPADPNLAVLGQPIQFPANTNGWQRFSVDFLTGPTAEAVQIALRRQPCDTTPCPIFGQLWLDDFSLRKQ